MTEPTPTVNPAGAPFVVEFDENGDPLPTRAMLLAQLKRDQVLAVRRLAEGAPDA